MPAAASFDLTSAIEALESFDRDMSNQSHNPESARMGSPPDWLSHFASAVTRNILSHDLLPPLGCHFVDSAEVCEVTIFAARTEIVGGSEDGQTTDARLFIDVKALLEVFARVD